MRAIRFLFAIGVSCAAGAATAQEFPASIEQAALAAWLPRNTDIDPRTIVSTGGGRVISVVRRGPGAVSGEQRVTVRTEIVTRQAAEQSGALSETQDLTVDCKGRRVKAGQMWSFSRRNLQGTTKTIEGWSEWAATEPGTTLARIVDAACGGRSTASGQAAPPAPSRDPLAAAAFSGGGDAPVSTSPATSTAPPPEAVETQPLPDPAPLPSPPEVGGEPEASRLAPPPRPATKPAANLQNLAQIGAANSPEGAQALLDAFRAAHPDWMGDRATSIEATVVGGQTFHRALIGGFADAADVQAFCRQVTATGAGCVVRLR